jgi:hypothetical protein
MYNRDENIIFKKEKKLPLKAANILKYHQDVLKK